MKKKRLNEKIKLLPKTLSSVISVLHGCQDFVNNISASFTILLATPAKKVPLPLVMKSLKITYFPTAETEIWLNMLVKSQIDGQTDNSYACGSHNNRIKLREFQLC